MQNFLALGLRPHTPCLRRMGVLLPNPHSTVARGFATRPQWPPAAWPPDPQNSLPQCEFLDTRQGAIDGY